MADILFSNNASALLAASISDSDTTIQVASGFGANFPSPTGGQYFMATLEDNAGDVEIVKCTARTGDNLTVVRGQEGTTAQAFTLNATRVELRLTKEVCEGFLQLSGGTMTGALAMGANQISGSNVAFTGGSITGITDLDVADGGTGASTAAQARINLGLEIGADVQAYNVGLSAIAAMTPLNGQFIVGNGSAWVAESGNVARTSLDLGTGNSVQFNEVSVGSDDTTIQRSAAGKLAVEGKGIFSHAGAFSGAQVHVSTSPPTGGDGTTGDIWLEREA